MRKTRMPYSILIAAAAIISLISCNSGQSKDISTPKDKSEVIDGIIMSRRSVRQFSERKISRDTLEIILRHGINAPNGQNRQAYEVRVADSPDFLARISEAVVRDHPEAGKRDGFKSIFAGAPCVIFLANDSTYDMSQVDCGLLGENIILSAWSMGIGTCCMAQPVRMMKNSEECVPLIEKMGFSKGFDLLYCIVMGYPEETPDAKPRKEERIKFVDGI